MYKNIKFFVYVILFIFVVLMLTLFMTQKNTYEKDKESKMIKDRISSQYSRTDNTNQTTENKEENNSELNLDKYVDKDINLDGNQQQPEANVKTDNVEKKEKKTKNVEAVSPQDYEVDEIFKISDAPQYKKYSVISAFKVDDIIFALVAKTSDYQSQYSKTVRKKVYLYKLDKDKLYQVMYLVDVPFPKDSTDESELFDIEETTSSVIINCEIGSSYNRKLNKFSLKNMSANKSKMLPVVIGDNSVADDEEDEGDNAEDDEGDEADIENENNISKSSGSSSDIPVLKKDAIYNLPKEN